MSLGSNQALDDNSELSTLGSERSTDSYNHSHRKTPFVGSSQPSCSLAPPSFFSDVLSHPLYSQSAPPPAIILCSHGKSSRKREEYVSEEFVERFNKRIGDSSSKKKAIRLMEKMRFIAGLHPSSIPEEVDIPSARTGFAMLAGLNDEELKKEALDHLEYLLENDPLTERSSQRLVSLTIKVMNQLDRELIQTESLEVQIKTAKIYGLLAELIQRHFAKAHINAITHDLREQLTSTARSLRDLNRLEDSRLNFYVESSLEGIKRILDDHKILYDILERLYNTGMLAISFYFRDLNHAPEYTEGAFGGIDPKFKFSWYDAALTLLKMGREVMTGKDFRTRRAHLAALQKFTYDNAAKLNWKFLFLAVDLMTNIAINSRDPEIRQVAFAGQKNFEEFPGVISYTNCQLLGKSSDFSPIVRLQRPKMVNTDATIRLYVAKSLIRISNESPDQIIRQKARLKFLNQLKNEKSQKVLKFMEPEFNKVQGHEVAWIHEESPYDNYPIKKEERETTSLTPRRSIDCTAFFQHTVYTPDAPV